MDPDEQWWPNPHEYTPPFSIEIRECGTWWEIGNTPILAEALRYASGLCEKHHECSILITDLHRKAI